MLDSLYIAATGMHAQQLNVDTISNNLANVNTAGFKRSRVAFADVLSRAVGSGGALLGTQAAARFGAGVAVADTTRVFEDGELKKSDGPLDLAIRGQGFLEVRLPDGTLAYTRSGALQVTRERLLATADGHVLAPEVQVPEEATSLVIDADGRVSARLPGESGAVEVGRLELARFVNPSALTARGGNLFAANEHSGDALYGRPGEEGFGTLAQGFLESSNVKLVEELVGLVLAQRAFEVSARAMQASDELLGMVNNLRR